MDNSTKPYFMGFIGIYRAEHIHSYICVPHGACDSILFLQESGWIACQILPTMQSMEELLLQQAAGLPGKSFQYQ